MVRGRPAAVIRGRRGVFRRGVFVPLVAFGALAAITIGSRFYDPDGYVAIAEPICSGFTPDGCRLQWQDVPTEDGGVEPQCVQYCPRPVAGIPAPVVVPEPAPAPVAAVAPAAGGCEMVVFREGNFAGASEIVNENEPALNADWDKQIASVQVKAGNWDLFSEADYGGESIRLTPGNYPTLGSQGTGQISSIMCSEPSP